MFRLALTLLAFACSGSTFAFDWQPEDTKREVIFVSLWATDWRQTRYIAKHPERYAEGNHAIGVDSTFDLSTCREGSSPNDTICDRVANPKSLKRVDQYFLATGLIQLGVAMTLPKHWRNRFQYLTIGMEASVVAHNYSVGVRLDF